MSEILKVKVQDENGNVFYIHTSADVVFCADGTSVQDRLGQKLDKSVIIQNATTAATDKVPSAAVAKDLQDQINQQNTNMIQTRGGWLSNLTIQASSNSTFKVTFTPFPRECIILIPIVRGGVQFPAWVNLLDNGSAEISAISASGSVLTGRNIQWIAIGR